MAHRAALLIRCSLPEAAEIRKRADSERRTVSGYLLNVLERQLQIDDRLAGALTPGLKLYQPERAEKKPQPRTAVLLRCSNEQGAKIRAGARRRGSSINGFVLFALKMVWKAVRLREASGNPGHD